MHEIFNIKWNATMFRQRENPLIAIFRWNDENASKLVNEILVAVFKGYRIYFLEMLRIIYAACYLTKFSIFLIKSIENDVNLKNVFYSSTKYS